MEDNHMVDKSQNVDMSKVEETVNRMDDQKKEEILRNFDDFKSYLHKRVAVGEKMGMGDETLAKTAEKLAGYLAEHEEPRNSEEYLLKELWKAGNDEQRHQLAHMLVEMVR